MSLTFMRNKVVNVEPLSERMLAVSWRVVDTLMESEIHLKIRLPDLEIEGAEARMERCPHPECTAASGLMEKALGVRVGPGIQKIVYGQEPLDAFDAFVKKWVELGGPRAGASYLVEAWPPDARKCRPKNGWLLRREHSRLVFRLRKRD